MIDPAVSMKFMIAGYVAISAVLILYLVSLVIRWRNLKRDLQTLDEIQKRP
jgi:hypothetical protein